MGAALGAAAVILLEGKLRPRAFISFDYDYDEDLRAMLVGQSLNERTPFDFSDRSVKEAMTGDWKAKVRSRISNTDLMIVICGAFTNRATGVSVELEIAQALGKPYFLLWGRPNQTCRKPISALPSDKIYAWKWDLIRDLIAGHR